MITLLIAASMASIIVSKDRPEFCSKLPTVTGKCRETSDAWYYSPGRNRCSKFKSNTCSSNDNRFATKSQCRSMCTLRKKRRTVTGRPAVGLSQKVQPAPLHSWKDLCLTEMESKNCRRDKNAKTKEIWFFNSSSGVCQSCNFDGKPSFKNKFSKQTECRWACVDVSAQWTVKNCNDCDSPTSFCSINEKSSASICHCKKGFDRKSGSKICQDSNECNEPLSKVCHPNARCTNTVGSYYCQCKSGYIGDGKMFCNFSAIQAEAAHCKVSTPQECASRGRVCAAEAACLHFEEKYFCQCPEGYIGDGVSCTTNKTVVETVDNRQCMVHGFICDPYAKCYLFGTKYFCQCSFGYFGNGTTCAPVPTPDPVVIDNIFCSRNNIECSFNAICYHHSPSTYSCKCKQGYNGNGTHCYEMVTPAPVVTLSTDQENCLRASLYCDKHAECKIAGGTYFCECSKGFAGNGLQCTTDPTACYESYDPQYTNQCGSYSFQKWYYFDSAKRTCRMFWFGKCYNRVYSRNVFSDQQTCHQFCLKSPALPQATTKPIYTFKTTAKFIATNKSRTEDTTVPKECRQPCKPGFCSSTAVMYFYNGISGQCQPFMYTGCGGNENRFPSVALCETACLSQYLQDIDEACLLPINNGYGKYDKACSKTSGTMHYYDPYLKDCTEFYYNGCGGNANRFFTNKECTLRCMRKVPSSLAILGKRNLRDCFEEKDDGYCKYIPNTKSRLRYYYESSNRSCTPFDYNGCGGNENRFGERSVCENVCGGLYKPKSRSCMGWADAGECNDISMKWHFNLKTGECQEFAWRGCGGNPNRFDTKLKCEQICI